MFRKNLRNLSGAKIVMPIYLFSNPSNPEEVVEVAMGINDKHEYIKDGIKWNRVFTVPQASKDTQIDCFNSKDFVLKSRDKKGTVGNLFDLSAELSTKREQKLGKDPYKEEYFQNYSKTRKGKLHPKQRQEKLKKGVELDVGKILKKLE